MHLPGFSLVLLSLLSISLAAKSTATSFCKCICFNNSTIIALNPPSSTQSSSSHLLEIRDSEKHHKLSCNDCTRAFCLDYNLPICKNAKEEDVFTSCFQRDSLKDEMVVIIFIIMTASLLGWAAVKPFVDRLRNQGTIPSFPSFPSRPNHAANTGTPSTQRGGFQASHARQDSRDEDESMRGGQGNMREEGEDEDIGLIGRR